MGPLPPTIGRYVVEELVGVGGMGQIYKAQDPVPVSYTHLTLPTKRIV